MTTNKSSAQIYMGARASSLNHSITALNNNNWAIFGNPATVDPTKKQVSSYFIRYYGITELSDIAIAASYPIKYGVILGGIHSYGFDLYRETDIQLGWMMSYADLKSAIKIHYDHVAFGGSYGNDGSIGIDIGLLFPIHEKVDIGASATNLNRPEIGVDGQERPRLLSVGIAYKPLDKGLILLDILKDVRYPIATRVGIEYPLLDQLVIRTGIGNNPINTTFGAGLVFGSWNVNFSVEKHQELGWSPGIDVGFTW